MRRKVLFPIIILLLTLTLLSTAPIFAVGPPKKGEDKTVSFTGDLVGEDTLTVDRKGGKLWVYGSIDLTFSSTFDGFVGAHGGGLRITIKDGEVTMYYDFDWEYNAEVGARVPLYHLEGSGTYSYEDGTYTVDLEDAAIYEVVPVRKGKGKKGAIGLEFVGPVWGPATINFDMTI